MTNCDVLIAGGGAAGMVLARLLGMAGIKVCLVDAGKPQPPLKSTRPDGRTVAMWSGSVAILERAGLKDVLDSCGTPITGLDIVDDSAYPRGGDALVEQSFSADELDLPAFGCPAITMLIPSRSS